MQWVRKNYKAIITCLICVIFAELAVSYYLVERFHELYLSRDEATAIALEDAGLTAEQVGGLTAKLKSRDGQAWYEIAFEQTAPPCPSYEYRVDAETGSILFSESKP